MQLAAGFGSVAVVKEILKAEKRKTILAELSRPETVKGSHLYILLQDTMRRLMFYNS